MKSLHRYLGDFDWECVPTQPYKPAGTHFRDVTRRVLADRAAGLAAELRYFEIGPDGHSTLERHRHAHAVVILRGEGRALVGDAVHSLRPFDVLRVPPLTWHQFRACPDQPLGFLCVVDAERDRAQRPTEQELAELRRHPEVAAFVRV